MLISILTDKTSWMNRHNVDLANRLKALGHDVRCVSRKQDLMNGDVAFLLSCFEIVPREYRARNRHNIVVHASALPSGRGWSPATWQILEGKNDIPLSLFEASDEVDAGSVYLRDRLQLRGNELLPEWQERLGSKIVDMCCLFTQQMSDLHGEAQKGEPSFYLRRKPEDSRLDVDKSIREQFNLLRIVDNEKYPAYFEHDGAKYTLKVYRS